jgi:DNA-damage-inducible protein D
MGDWELIFTMVGEKATTDITRTRNAKGFDECKGPAKRGGQIANNARKELEQETGESVISKNNFLGITKKKKLIN